MRRAALLAAAMMFGVTVGRAAELPAWLQQAVATPDDSAWRDAPLAELLRESAVALTADGKVTERRRRVLRVRAPEARSEASVSLSYDAEADRIVSVKAWVVHADGRHEEVKPDAIHDIAQVADELYSAERVRIVNAADQLEEGAALGVEIVREGRTIFAEQAMEFQDDAPVAVARLALTLPPGWTAAAHVFNREPPLEPLRDGQTWTWELRGLPWRQLEPQSPPLRAVLPWLAVHCVPSPGAPASKTTAALDSWTAWSDWLNARGQLADVDSPALRAQAQSLVAGAVARRDSIARLARFVQALRYTAVIVDAAHGGGVTPHPACDVFEHGYGDCKDKASLLRTMLRVVGIEARLVSAYSGDPDHIHPEWASPAQFNHCIAAIAVSDSLAGEPIVRSRDGRRWLLFDATDPYTRLGDLPEALQGSFVLLRGAEGDLIRAPRRPIADNAITTHTDIDADSTGAARVRTRWTGRYQGGRELRAAWRAESARDHRAAFEGEVARVAPGTTVSRMQFAGDSADVAVEEVEYDAPHWIRNSGGGRATAPLVWLPLGITFGDENTPRTQPLLIDDLVREDTVVVRLVTPVAPGPLLPPAHFDSPAGTYDATAVSDGATLVLTRHVALRRQVLPATAALELRRFARAIRAFEAQRVVVGPEH